MNAPTPHRVILEEDPGYAEMVECTARHGCVTFQFVRDEDGHAAELLTMTWPVERHGEVVAMMGRAVP